jgi:hypothetical protein
MDPATTTNKANYTLTGSAGAGIDFITIREVLEGTKVVSVATVNVTNLTANTVYTLAIINAKDNNNNTIAAGTAPKTTSPGLTVDFNGGDLGLWPGLTAGGNGQIAFGTGPDLSDMFQMTDAVNSQQGALRIDAPAITADPVTNFTAIFKLFIGNGSVNAADGMSFNFGTIPTSVISVGEEGTGTISVDFDTFNNGNSGPLGRPEGPSFDIKLNGTMIGWAPLTKAAMVNDQWVDMIISLNGDNSISALYNGVTYFNHLSLNNPTNVIDGTPVTPYSPVANGSFLIGGRTGGENARQALDDLSISINSSTAGGPPANVKITFTKTATDLTINWNAGPNGMGTLHSAPSLDGGGTFTTTGDSDGSYTTPLSGTERFFKVKGP